MAEDFVPEDAAEFVLGTLPPDERRAFLRVLSRDPRAVAEVQYWQERFAPLALSAGDVAPPAELEPRILAAIGDATSARPANDNRAGGWKFATMAAALVAVVASGVALRPHGTIMPPPTGSPPAAVQTIAYQPPSAVAALTEGGQTPGLFVTYDKGTGKMHVIPVGLTPDQAHSYELWMIEGKNAPKPMGLVDAGKAAERAVSGGMAMGATMAISREPVGGSPTGAPTGPVLMTGALVSTAT